MVTSPYLQSLNHYNSCAHVASTRVPPHVPWGMNTEEERAAECKVSPLLPYVTQGAA